MVRLVAVRLVAVRLVMVRARAPKRWLGTGSVFLALSVWIVQLPPLGMAV